MDAVVAILVIAFLVVIGFLIVFLVYETRTVSRVSQVGADEIERDALLGHLEDKASESDRKMRVIK